jgi:hypothetical protein
MPNTSNGIELEAMCPKSPCIKTAQITPINPFGSLGKIPNSKKLKSDVDWNKKTIHINTTNNNGKNKA